MTRANEVSESRRDNSRPDVVSSTLEKEYEALRAKVMVRAAKYSFSRPDSEDILHDVVLEILERQVNNVADYCEVVTRVLGRHRMDRFRRGLRYA